MKISGSLPQLLTGLDRSKIPVKYFIGLPINDSNGKKIGVITAIDIDNNVWHGEILCSMDNRDIISSFEMTIPSKLCGISLNAIRERFGFEPIKNKE